MLEIYFLAFRSGTFDNWIVLHRANCLSNKNQMRAIGAAQEQIIIALMATDRLVAKRQKHHDGNSRQVFDWVKPKSELIGEK